MIDPFFQKHSIRLIPQAQRGVSFFLDGESRVSLIHHQDIICGVAIDRFSLRRIAHTPQSLLLGA
jgi:hypothetical protein